ncbi:MAG: substrate-binding domain-containing protein [Actinobacteria bacterium]|nr:substrate-binding domain-containing protein [Actinomycetota bacterium]
MRRFVISVAAVFVVAAACNNGSLTGRGNDGKCATVELASSPEKVELLTKLAAEFNGSDAAKRGGCASVHVSKKSSGAAATALVNGWRDTAADGAQPVIWSPSSSLWGGVVNQRRAAASASALVPANAQSFMQTPLVIAMPRPMAQALGWPATAIGYSDLLKLAQDPNGWASKGHPEWGPFRLGKTNLNFSTSALAATTAQYYAATGKVRDLTLEDLDKPDVQAFSKSVESTVVHYGDTTLTFLNNWFRNDARGTSLTYVSAVAVEEKSVIDYNRGNPDGITQEGEVPRRPKIPLVAIYPKEGTFFSDNPFFVLDAPWVNAAARSGAQRFADFVREPDNQRQVLRTGFRPGNPAVALGSPINADNGLDPAQPQTTLGAPSAPVLVKIIDQWAQLRKGARVLLVMDVSGSMGDDAGNGDTKLELAKQAAIDALAQFKGDDLVGLRIFTTNAANKDPRDYLDLVPIGPIGAQRESLERSIRGLVPREGTPLYTTAKASYEEVKASFDPSRINAVVLLTDGQNDDPRNNDLDALVAALRAGSEGLSSTPVRLFTIAYGKGASLGVLKRMAEATNAAAYDASDPQTIANVFTQVISNF